MKMTLSQNGINLIKSFEGCRLTAYVDTSGVLTIGYGHTGGVTKGQTVTQAQADEMLKKDLANYANGVQALIDNKTILFNVNQNMFDSLTSFCYNCGKGNLLKLVKSRTVSEVAEHITAYNKSAGKVLTGLVRRRQAEKDLFLKPIPNSPSQTFRTYTVKKGDTLSGIAKSLHTTVKKLAEMNNIKNVNLIIVGQAIKY